MCWFDSHNIKYVHHYKDKRCKDKRVLDFDFQVFKNDGTFVLYEYDGRLHTEKWNNTAKSNERLNLQKKHDIIKNKFCKDNNITLYRISYKEKLKETLETLFLTKDFLPPETIEN